MRLIVVVAVLCLFNKEGVVFARTPDLEDHLMPPTPDKEQECASLFENFNYEKGVIYCDSVYDQSLCWGPTHAGKTVAQNCPDRSLSDTKQQAFRTCGEAGQWLDRQLKQSSSDGWTNDTLCFPKEVKLLLNKDSEQDVQAKFDIDRNSRYWKIFGYSIPLIVLLISLFIFRYLRNQLLKNIQDAATKSLSEPEPSRLIDHNERPSSPQSISEGTQRRSGHLQYAQIVPRPRYTETLSAIYSSLPSVLAWCPSIYSDPPSLDESRRAFSMHDLGLVNRAIENRDKALFKNIQVAAAKSLLQPCRLIDHNERPSSRLAIRDVGSLYLNYGLVKSDFILKLERAAIKHVRPSGGRGKKILSPYPMRRLAIIRPISKKTALPEKYGTLSMRFRQDTGIEMPAPKYRLHTSDSMRMMSIFTFENENINFNKKPQRTESNLDQKQTVSGHLETTATIESGEGRSSIPNTQSTATKSSSIGNRPTMSVPELLENYNSIKEFEDVMIVDGDRPSSIAEESESDSFSLEYEQATSGASREETASSMDEYRSLSSAAEYARRSHPRRESYESNNSAASGTSLKSVRFNLEQMKSQAPTDKNSE